MGVGGTWGLGSLKRSLPLGLAYCGLKLPIRYPAGSRAQLHAAVALEAPAAKLACFQWVRRLSSQPLPPQKQSRAARAEPGPVPAPSLPPSYPIPFPPSIYSHFPSCLSRSLSKILLCRCFTTVDLCHCISNSYLSASFLHYSPDQQFVSLAIAYSVIALSCRSPFPHFLFRPRRCPSTCSSFAFPSCRCTGPHFQGHSSVSVAPLVSASSEPDDSLQNISAHLRGLHLASRQAAPRGLEAASYPIPPPSRPLVLPSVVLEGQGGR